MQCFGQDCSHPILEGRTLVLRGTQRPPWPLQMSQGWLYTQVLPTALAPALFGVNTHSAAAGPGQRRGAQLAASAACSSPPVTSLHLCFDSAPPWATVWVDKLCQKPSVSLPFLFSFTGGNCPCARQRHGFSSSFPPQAACRGVSWKALHRQCQNSLCKWVYAKYQRTNSQHVLLSFPFYFFLLLHSHLVR